MSTLHDQVYDEFIKILLNRGLGFKLGKESAKV